MKSAPAIAFDYRPSRWLVAAVAAVTLAASIAILQSGLPLALRLALLAAAVAYATYSLRRFRRQAPRRLAWHAAGHWRVADADGGEHTAELARAVVRGGWIVLGLRRQDGRRLRVILAPDNSDADTRRRLRVRLARGDDAP
jgi:toxin CptA